jgi:repressor LexA
MGRTPPGQTRERVFRLVRDRLLDGLPPTIREVQQAFRFRSVQTAREHLEVLVREGRLTKHQGKSRGYRLPGLPGESDRPARLIPLLGRVQAGDPNTAVEDLEGYIPIQTRHDPDQLFGLRVRGESMNGAGILPGDIVVVRRQPTANTGDIVVALVGDGEATVKRLRLRGKRVELHPENPDFKPIVPDPDRGEGLTLLGKVVEIRRLLDPS